MSRFYWSALTLVLTLVMFAGCGELNVRDRETPGDAATDATSGGGDSGFRDVSYPDDASTPPLDAGPGGPDGGAVDGGQAGDAGDAGGPDPDACAAFTCSDLLDFT